jgi:TonB-dependent starch-binding outer membrane protein SusC
MSKGLSLFIVAAIALNLIYPAPVLSQDTSAVVHSQYPSDTDNLSTTIKQSDSNKGLIVSPWQAVQGKIPGLTIISNNGEPGSDYTVTNMKNQNFLGNSSPYVIVDGMPLWNVPFTINPNDIESFNYLDDGAAAALYGGQSANGVMIVTTRKATDALKVHYSSSYTVSKIQNRFNIYDPWAYTKAWVDRFGSTMDPFELLGTAATDWQDKVFQKAYGQDQYLSLSGKIAFLPVRVSFGKTLQEGIVRTSKFDRTTLGLALSPSFFKDHLKLRFNVSGVLNNSRKAYKNTIQHTFLANPTFPVYNTTGENGGYFHSYDTYNPVAELMQTRDMVDSDQWVGDAGLEYNFHYIRGLRFSADFGRISYLNIEKVAMDTAAAWIPRNYTERSNDTIKNKFYDIRLAYSKRIQLIHTGFELFAGVTEYNTKTNYYHWTESTAGYSYSYGWYKDQQKASYGGLSVSVKDKYNVIFDLRKDSYGESVFPKKNREKRTSSILVSWDLKREPFLESVNALSALKLNAGCSQSGNYNRNYYDFLSDKLLMYNSKLKQETINSFNAGISFGLLSDKIKGNIEYFNKEAKDLPIYANLGGWGFFDGWLLNLSSIKTAGVETSLHFNVLSGKDVEINSGLTFLLVKNRVGKLAESIDYIAISDYCGIVDYPDKPINSFYLLRQMLDQDGHPIEGEYLDSDGDGHHDLNFEGTTYPTAIIGLNCDVRYRKWDLSFAARMFKGNHVFNMESFNSCYSNLFVNNCSRILNDSRFGQPQWRSDYYLENASFFRMDYVNLGYNLRIKNIEKILFNISATVQNAFVITSYRGQDPEVVGGVSDYDYPRPRTFSLNISADF